MSYTPTIWETGDIITAQKLNKMENAMHAILSDYEPTNWVDGDIITAVKLNRLENAIEYVNFDYIKTIWRTNDIITSTLLNNMESGIELASVDKTWEEMNWDDIIIATRTGKYQTFNVGNMKELNLGTEGIVHMQIVGIDEDDLADESDKAALSFISHELLATAHRMNPERTPSESPFDVGTGSIGGFAMSEIKEYLLTNIGPLLPQNIRNSIKAVNKVSRSVDTRGYRIINSESVESLWIPSLREIFGAVTTDVGTSEEYGPIYSGVFNDANSRLKSVAGSTTSERWWLRSTYNATYFFNTRPAYAEGFDCDPATKIMRFPLGFCL